MSAPTTRRRTGAALLTALISVILMLGAAPAYGDIYEDNGGKPGERDYTNNRGVTEVFTFRCDREGNMIREGRGVVYDGPHPGCLPPTDSGFEVEQTDRFALCQPAMQVFRFYGTVKRPVAGWSTSMVNQQDWCSPTDARMWSTSRYDVQNQLTLANFDQEALGSNPTPDLGHTPLPDSINARGLNLHPMYAMRWTLRNASSKITATRPFAGNKNCAATQSGNPFQTALNDPERSAESKNRILTQLRDALRTEKDKFAAEFGVGNAAALAAAQKITGILTVDVNGGTVSFVTGNCASAMQYVTTADLTQLSKTSEQNKFRVTGVCYIPVERLAREVRRKDGRTQWTWPAIKNQKWGGGLRYSDYYKGKDYTAGNFVNQIDSLPDEHEQNIVNAWRDQIASWYLGTTGPRMDSLNLGGNNQAIPAEPYITRNQESRVPAVWRIDDQTYNRMQAMRAVRDYSKCQFGPHIYFEEKTVVQAPPAPTANLLVENQAVQNSGGYGSEDQSFTVIDRGLRCDDGRLCVGRDIQFVDLTYTVRITGPDGWRFATGSPTGGGSSSGVDAQFWVSEGRSAARGLSCSANVCTLPVRATYTGSRIAVSSRYFKPTMPGEKVRVSVQGVNVRFRQIIDVTVWEITTGPKGKKIWQRTTRPQTQQVNLNRIEVDGDPVPLNGGIGNRWFEMRILGATSVR